MDMDNVQRIAKSVHVADLEIRCTFVNLPLSIHI